MFLLSWLLQERVTEQVLCMQTCHRTQGSSIPGGRTLEEATSLEVEVNIHYDFKICTKQSALRAPFALSFMF